MRFILPMLIAAIFSVQLAQADPAATDSNQLFEVGYLETVVDSLATQSNSCESAEMQKRFEACVYHRANCWEYRPGGYCYGVPNTWGRCYGRRPPRLGC